MNSLAIPISSVKICPWRDCSSSGYCIGEWVPKVESLPVLWPDAFGYLHFEFSVSEAFLYSEGVLRYGVLEFESVFMQFHFLDCVAVKSLRLVRVLTNDYFAILNVDVKLDVSLLW